MGESWDGEGEEAGGGLCPEAAMFSFMMMYAVA